MRFLHGGLVGFEQHPVESLRGAGRKGVIEPLFKIHLLVFLRIVILNVLESRIDQLVVCPKLFRFVPIFELGADVDAISSNYRTERAHTSSFACILN